MKHEQTYRLRASGDQQAEAFDGSAGFLAGKRFRAWKDVVGGAALHVLSTSTSNPLQISLPWPGFKPDQIFQGRGEREASSTRMSASTSIQVCDGGNKLDSDQYPQCWQHAGHV